PFRTLRRGSPRDPGRARPADGRARDRRRRQCPARGGRLMALGVFSRLKEGLTRSTQKLGEGLSNLTAVVRNRRLDDEALEELEDALISADLGTEVARRVIGSFRRSRFGKEVTDEEIRQALADELAAILEPVAHPLRLDPANKPHVVLVVGVNGTGKTT